METKNTPKISKTKVYFNNSCSICRAEINVYKKYSDENIEWVDISSDDNVETETKKGRDELYRRMHVLKNGQIISGAETFLIIWKKIPRYNFLYKFFNKPIIFPIFNIIYEFIAYFLYLKSKLFR